MTGGMACAWMGVGVGIARPSDTRFDLRVEIKRVEIHKMFLIRAVETAKI